MADEIKPQENIEEGYTEFGGSPNAKAGGFYNPVGPIGRFFAKFFATQAQKKVVKDLDQGVPNLSLIHISEPTRPY